MIFYNIGGIPPFYFKAINRLDGRGRGRGIASECNYNSSLHLKPEKLHPLVCVCAFVCSGMRGCILFMSWAYILRNTLLGSLIVWLWESHSIDLNGTVHHIPHWIWTWHIGYTEHIWHVCKRYGQYEIHEAASGITWHTTASILNFLFLLSFL